MSIAKYDRKALQQFKPSTKIEKIKYWYMQEMVDQLDHDPVIKLSEEEHELRRKLEDIFGMLTDYKSPKTAKEVREIVMGWQGVSIHTAYRLVKMAQELFTDVEQMEKSVMRVLQTELRRKAIAAIQGDDDLDAYEKHELIHKNLTRIEQINHLEDKDVLNMDQLLDLLELPDTDFTTDIDALEAEEIEYEDVEEDSKENMD